MTAITRISRLRDYGVFCDFTWPSDLPDFGRYNLIYGWNWSGKTTLSKLFRALELRTPPGMGQAIVRIDANDLAGEDFRQVTLPVRVFNRDFVNESVFPISGGDVPPIFVLGKESVEKQKEADRLKTERTTVEADLASARSCKQDAERTLDRYCIDWAKVIKDTLRSSGSNPYNNYNKSDFSRRADDMVSAGDKDTHLLSDSARDKLLAQLRGSPKSKLQLLTYRLPDLKAQQKRVADLLSKTVVSSAILSLKDDARLSSWVHSGLELHQERDSKTCLFCNQPMPEDRLAALGAHFSTEYEGLMRTLDNEIAGIQAAIRAGTDLAIPNPAELYDDLLSEFESASSALLGERNSAKRMLNALVTALEDKKARAFERVDLTVASPELNTAVVEKLHGVILKHNQACGDFQSRIESARKRIEADSVAGNLDQYLNLKGGVESAEASVTKAVCECKRLADYIGKLEREIVEHRKPAEELSEDLRNYLGHSELRLDVKETGYTIMRNDSAADSLSEGEMTAVALLYFLKSLQDRRFDLARGVVVLDDPVSSLDANALYFAFGFIRERTQNASQLIILTHNFTFFRQVRNWFHHLKGQNKKDVNHRPARFFMVDCTHERDGRRAVIRGLDPLLEQYDSEYHYLFAYIYRVATAPPQACLEQNYMLPNPARRLLEAFLAFRQPQLSGELWQKLQAVQFDEAKKIRILRFLHTHSHTAALGEPGHDPSLLSEGRSILNDLLSMIQSQDADHFSAMVKLVEPASEEGDDV
jgi:wobble nucleotide-excising tRNase